MKKRVLLILGMLLAGYSAGAQFENFSVKIMVPQEDIPVEAKNQLMEKLTQIAVNYGLGNDSLSDRFVLTANVLVSTKDIVPSSPPRISQRLDVVLYLGDVVENKVYSSLLVSAVGVGQNENKAYINAFQRIPTRSAALTGWITETKDKVLAYYESNGAAILDRADFLVASGDPYAAIASLLSVPEIASLSDAAREKAVEIRQTMINRENRKRLTQARDIWTIGQDEKSAMEALELLSEIDVDSDSTEEAATLIDAIGKQMKSRKNRIEADRQREWEFRMKQYEDDLEMRRQQIKDQNAVERVRAEVLRKTSEKVAGIDFNKVAIVVKGWFGN